MRVSLQVFMLFLAVIAVGCIAGPPLYMAMREIFGTALGIGHAMEIPFDRFLTRVFLVLALVFLTLRQRSLHIQDSIKKSLQCSGPWFYLLRTGFMLGVASLLLLMIGMSFCGAVRFHALALPASDALSKFSSAMASALAVGFIEEIFFRGFVLQSLQREMKTWLALLVTSLFYAVLHYFKAPHHVMLQRLDWGAGFSTALKFFAPFGNIQTMIPGVIGLTLVGLVLGLAYLRSGSLYLSIGLHAGWVFVIKFNHLFAAPTRTASRVWFGDEKMVTGIASWAMLAAVGALIAVWGKKLAQNGKPAQP